MGAPSPGAPAPQRCPAWSARASCGSTPPPAPPSHLLRTLLVRLFLLLSQGVLALWNTGRGYSTQHTCCIVLVHHKTALPCCSLPVVSTISAGVGSEEPVMSGAAIVQGLQQHVCQGGQSHIRAAEPVITIQGDLPVCSMFSTASEVQDCVSRRPARA